MTDLIIENQNFEARKISTSHANILIIKANQGFLGCGYFDIETANKLKEPVAIVTGVKTYEDMLSAKVIKVSDTASEMGIQLNSTGKEALLILNK